MVLWQLQDIYGGQTEQELHQKLKRTVDRFEQRKSKLASLDVKDFVQALHEANDIAELGSRLESHASLHVAENTLDPKRNARNAKLQQEITLLGNKTLFFNLWFMHLAQDKAEPLLKASGKYRYMLQRIRAYREHTLLEDEEKIINLKDLTGCEELVRIYRMITSAYSFSWKKNQINEEELVSLAMSSKRTDRVN